MNQLRVADQPTELSPPDSKLWDSLILMLAIAIDVSDGRFLATRIEDLAGDVALDRIQPFVIANSVEETEPLVGVISVRDVVVANFGFRAVARVDSAIAGVADDAETETFGGYVERHFQETRIDEMGGDEARLWFGPGEDWPIFVSTFVSANHGPHSDMEH